MRDDDMGAAQHRQEAERETGAAARELDTREAELRREHARQHAAAAQFLERFEDRACARVTPSARAGCPLLGPLVRLDEIDGGIRATFADPARAERALAEMRCHYAYARARHFEETSSCPLYVRDVEIRTALDPAAIEIVSRDEPTTRLIRARAREQAIYRVKPR